MKNVGKHQSNFDLDLEYGNEGENFVLSLLNGATKVEVKTDRMAHHTGNIAIEYEFNGKPSGISTTKADYWAFVLGDKSLVVFIKTENLKDIARAWFKSGSVVSGGDFNSSKMILIPINEILIV